MTKTKWNIDEAHSDIQFKVKHLMISTVTGQFREFAATVETEGEDFTTAKVHFSAKVGSVSTNNEKRDEHLRNSDFFEAETWPELIFEGAGMEKISDDTFKLKGILTLRGVSKEITLDVEYGGITKDPWGNIRTGFTVSGKINRQDYGMSFGMVTEGGGLMLGDEVKIHAAAEFVKEAVAVAA